MDKFTVACIQQKMHLPQDLAEYRADLDRFARVAQAKNARLVIFPELAGMMDVYPQKLVNVPVSRKPDIFSVPRIAAVIRDIETGLGENGRVLVRYSGTENLCRVMVEAQSAELAETGCNRIAEVVRSILN